MFRDNLFTAIKSLESVVSKKTTSSKHCARLTKLLYGDDKVNGLFDLSKEFNEENYKYLHNEVNLFYRATSIRDFSLKIALKKAKLALTCMVNTKDPGSSEELSSCQRAYACMQDDIFTKTTEKYHGIVIAPIAQALDYRLAASKGECAGYVMTWAQSLLSKKDPFGIKYQQGPLFKPIKFNSEAGKKYPDLNHTIKLTKEIAQFQQSKEKKLYDFNNNKRIYRSTASLPAFYKNGSDIAIVLTTLAAQNKNAVYYLAIHKGIKGHALGFYMDEEGNSHFLDVNTGWFKFSSIESFSSWMDYYFKKKKYDKNYPEFFIYSYGFDIFHQISFKRWISTQPRFLLNKCRDYFKNDRNLFFTNKKEAEENLDVPSMLDDRINRISLDDFALSTAFSSFINEINRDTYRGIEALVDEPLEKIIARRDASIDFSLF